MKKKTNILRIISISLASLALSFSNGLSAKQHSIVEPKEAEAATYNQSVNDYYSGINWDQTGATLKTALFNKIKITTAGWTYDGLWTAYKTTDVRPDGTHFWDIYSDTTMYTLNDSRINASYKKEGDSINREHVIPQSTFNEASPMKSDVHHVLPSDGYVNNRRSAYPHGNVTGSPTYTSNDGCKLGSGTGSTTVFEPMDNYKGDIARIYFYFVTCYQDKMSSNSFSAFDKSTHPSIKTAFLNVYLQWAKDDPVSEKEIKRNNAAYAGQGNRNPFIDCPYAVGAIWDPTHASDYGNKGEYTSGTGVTISKASANLISGNTTTISATSTDSSSITWTTSNSSVVSLSSASSSSGNSITLTAGIAGSATITATATIGGTNYSKTCTVTVSSTKQVASISVSGQKTSYAVGDTFVKPTVTATYNDDTQATVTSDATCSGYDMSTAGDYTVTVSYSYGGATKTTTFDIKVSSSGGSGSISDYTISSTPLTSSGITNNMLVVWGTPTLNLASSIGSNWVYLSDNSNDWLIFTLEGTSSGFKLKNEDNYVYSSAAKKVEFSSTSYTTFTLNNAGLVKNNTIGTFYYNSSGLRPYATGSYTNAYLYALTPNKTLSEIDVHTSPETSYEVGDTFDPTGLVITRTYSDNSSDTYSYANHTSEFTFNPDLSTALSGDDETIEITYGGQSCFLPITVSISEKTLTSIAVATAPTKTSYVIDETFSPTGLVITRNYSDSTSDTYTYANHTSEFAFSPSLSTPLDVSDTSVTITYGGKSCLQAITVSTSSGGSSEPTSITASVSKTYYVGDTISTSDITVEDNNGDEVEGFSFANDGYTFTYNDAVSGGTSTNKTFINSISYNTLTCSLIVQVQRKAREDVSTSTASVTYADLPTAYQTSTTERTAESGIKFIAYNLAHYNNSSKMQFRASGGYFQTTQSMTLKSLTINNRETNALTVYGSTNGTSFTTSIVGTNDVYNLTGYNYVKVMKNGSGAAYCASLTITYGGEDSAGNLANYIMYEDTANQCTTKLNTAIGYLAGLSSSERTTFSTSNDYVISTAKERLDAWALNQGKQVDYENGELENRSNMLSIINLQTENNSPFILIVLLTTCGFTVTLLYLKRKRQYK